jgi:hypothetical protein
VQAAGHLGRGRTQNASHRRFAIYWCLHTRAWGDRTWLLLTRCLQLLDATPRTTAAANPYHPLGCSCMENAACIACWVTWGPALGSSGEAESPAAAQVHVGLLQPHTSTAANPLPHTKPMGMHMPGTVHLECAIRSRG